MNCAIRSHASAISKRYFFVSRGSIDYDLRLFKGFAEIRIPDWSWLHKINRAMEQAFEILCEPEELLCMLRWLHLLKFNKQIKIAFTCIEPVTGC